MKNIIYVMLVMVLLLVSGCGNGDTETNTGHQYIGGTNAVEFEFMDEAPPDEVYDMGSYPFEISLMLDNKGEFDVPKDKMSVKLLGFYPQDFGNPAVMKQPDEDLTKTYIESEGDIVDGTKTFVTFPGFNFEGELSTNNEYKIRATVCYTYGTTAQVDLCILDDLTDSKDTVCDVKDSKKVASSSGPIQISNAEEYVAGTDKIGFSFDVSLERDGTISKKETGCSDQPTDKDRVWIEVDTGGLSGLSCAGLTEGSERDGYVALYGDLRQIRCTLDTNTPESDGKDFEKKITVTALYDYSEFQEKTILVKHTT